MITSQPRTFSNVSRGHMNPCAINTFDAKYGLATFTLANASPQYETFNSGKWNQMEELIRNYANKVCAAKRGTLYLLTGTSSAGLQIAPNGEPIQDNAPWPDPAALPKPPARNNVAIPRSMWTAGCCVWQANMAESFAVMTNNRNNAAKLYQTEMSLQKLETLLTLLRAPTVNLFPGDKNCRLSSKILSQLKIP